MRSGELKKLVVVQTLTVTSDGMGSSVESWSAYKSDVWAAIWPVSAKERIQAGKQEMETTHRIRIRYFSGLTAAMRIKYGTRYFKIISIINVREEDRLLEILATEEQ